MTEQSNAKPLSWLIIILILMAAALGTGLFFGLIGTYFSLSPNLTRAGIPAVVGVLAAFLVLRRRAAIDRQDK